MSIFEISLANHSATTMTTRNEASESCLRLFSNRFLEPTENGLPEWWINDARSVCCWSLFHFVGTVDSCRVKLCVLCIDDGVAWSSITYLNWRERCTSNRTNPLYLYFFNNVFPRSSIGLWSWESVFNVHLAQRTKVSFFRCSPVIIAQQNVRWWVSSNSIFNAFSKHLRAADQNACLLRAGRRISLVLCFSGNENKSSHRFIVILILFIYYGSRPSDVARRTENHFQVWKSIVTLATTSLAAV